MDILRNLFGNLTAGVIRLAVAAGILFCAYLFIVKPVLDTTEDAFRSSGLDRIGKTLDTVSVGVQREIRRSFRTVKEEGGHPKKLIACIQHAKQDVKKIERCTRRF